MGLSSTDFSSADLPSAEDSSSSGLASMGLSSTDFLSADLLSPDLSSEVVKSLSTTPASVSFRGAIISCFGSAWSSFSLDDVVLMSSSLTVTLIWPLLPNSSIFGRSFFTPASPFAALPCPTCWVSCAASADEFSLLRRISRCLSSGVRWPVLSTAFLNALSIAVLNAIPASGCET